MKIIALIFCAIEIIQIIQVSESYTFDDLNEHFDAAVENQTAKLHLTTIFIANRLESQNTTIQSILTTEQSAIKNWVSERMMRMRDEETEIIHNSPCSWDEIESCIEQVTKDEILIYKKTENEIHQCVDKFNNSQIINNNITIVVSKQHANLINSLNESSQVCKTTPEANLVNCFMEELFDKLDSSISKFQRTASTAMDFIDNKLIKMAQILNYCNSGVQNNTSIGIDEAILHFKECVKNK